MDQIFRIPGNIVHLQPDQNYRGPDYLPIGYPIKPQQNK